MFPTFKPFYKIGSYSGKNISGTMKGMINIYEFLEKNSQEFQLTVLVKVCNLLSVYELLEQMVKTKGNHVTRHYCCLLNSKGRCSGSCLSICIQILCSAYSWDVPGIQNPGYIKSIVKSSKCWCVKKSGKRVCARITGILLKMLKNDYKLKCWKWQSHTQAATYTEQAVVL